MATCNCRGGVDCCLAAPVPRNEPGAADLPTDPAAYVVPEDVQTVYTSPGCACYPANRECPSEARCERWEDVKAAGHPGYMALLEELRDLHKTKSGGYGTTTDPFGNFTQVAAASGEPRYLYPVLRSIEKLTRVLSLHAQGRAGELEEELLDVSSLNLCAAAMLREDS